MSKGKVLIVDDDKFVRSFLTSTLRSVDYAVEAAEDGRQALEQFQSQPDIELIVSDINMPVMDGLELIRQVRMALRSEVPVIVLSGNQEISVALEAINSGASTYLMKDKDMSHALPLAAEHVLEKKRLVDKNRELMAEITRKNEELSSVVDTMTDIGIALTAEENYDKLLAVIVTCGRALTNAEAGILYRVKPEGLVFRVIQGHAPAAGTQGKADDAAPPAPLEVTEDTAPGYVAVTGETVNIPDINASGRFDFSAEKARAAASASKTQSLLVVPLSDNEGTVLGVLELANARDSGTEQAVPFSASHEKFIESLTSQAALVMANARLQAENLRRARLSALGEGIAGAAHCVKNILSGFDGGRYILDLGIKRQNMDNIAKGWDMLQRNSDILKTLVLDMLTYSKDRTPEYEQSDINEICTNVGGLMEERAKAKNAGIKLALQDDIGEMRLDPKGVFRCLLNLVGNAVDSLGDDAGEVTIGTQTRTSANVVDITVADNGSGISEEVQEKLFKPFFSTKSSKGTGLGLALVQKIIREHGGSIAVQSELDVGTTFTVTLPLSG